MMKYKWIEKPTCEELETKLGCTINSKVVSPAFPEMGEPAFIELDLENETPEILQRLDLLLQGYQREGGRDIEIVISDNIVTEYPNPQKEAYKLSQLYGLTHEQLDIYIDNNVTDLQSAREFIRKLSHVVLYLVKQTKLDV